MRSVSFKNDISKMHLQIIYLIYMYKEEYMKNMKICANNVSEIAV